MYNSKSNKIQKSCFPHFVYLILFALICFLSSNFFLTNQEMLSILDNICASPI